MTKTLNVTLTRRFQATPERVFDAWLDPAKARRFLFGTPTGEIVRVDMDPRVGGGFVITDRRDGVDVEHLGQYLELERPRRLVFSFTVSKFTDLTTRVSIDIRPVEGGCELTLQHEGVLADYGKATQEGWGKILAGLANLLAG